MDVIRSLAESLGQYVLTITAPLLVAVTIAFLFAVAKAILKALNALALPPLARVLIVAAEDKLKKFSGPEKMSWVVDKVVAWLPNLHLKREELQAALQAIYDLTAADPTAPTVGTAVPSEPLALDYDTVTAIGEAVSPNVTIDHAALADAVGQAMSSAVAAMPVASPVDYGPLKSVAEMLLNAAPTTAAPVATKKVATRSAK